MKAIDKALPFLCCPLDHGALVRSKDSFLACTTCHRTYPLLGDSFIELLPPAPVTMPPGNPSYKMAYQTLFNQPFRHFSGARAWGRLDQATPRWAVNRQRQIDFIKKHLAPAPMICDISAGAGNYTFDFAKHFDLVLHCDLSATNLSDVHARMKRQGISNIVLIRCDYLRLPFQQSLPQIICMDTLIRGKAHEASLLKNLAEALCPGGTALVDFHNWWHNPLRRLGVLKENFDTSHTRRGAEAILTEAGIPNRLFLPFYQEVDPSYSRRTATLIKTVLPPTRLVYRIGG